MKSWKVEAAIIAVGLLLLGIMVKGGINNFVNKDRVVSVKGLAEMEVPADKVVWPLVYKDIGNDPALLYANMEKKNAAIVGFLENNGIEKEEISIAPPEVIDMQAERYVDPTWLIVIMPRLSSLSLPRMWIGYVNSCPGKQNS